MLKMWTRWTQHPLPFLAREPDLTSAVSLPACGLSVHQVAVFNNEQWKHSLKRASGQREYCRPPNEPLLGALITVILSEGCAGLLAFVQGQFSFWISFHCMSEINNVFNCCDGAYTCPGNVERALRKLLHCIVHSLGSDSYYSHFIDEESEDQKVAACLGMHGWYMTVLSPNLDLSDVQFQLVPSLCSSGFKEERFLLTQVRWNRANCLPY